MMPMPFSQAEPMLSEMFCAIQSEGSLAGVPAVFLVSVDGPARPVWGTKPRGAWKVDPSAALGRLLSEVRRSWYDYVVITGGEPLRVAGLPEFAAKLREFDHHVTVETSGGVYTDDFPCDLMSVNICLSSPSGKKKSANWPVFDRKILARIVERYPYQVKFYCSEVNPEWDEIKRICDECNVKRSNVFLIPTAASGKNLAAQLEWMEELSRVNGYRLSPRLIK
jgi:organic radical activating enzyme